MDDAVVMRRFERFGDLPGDRQGFLDWNRTASDDTREVFALHELHGQRGDLARSLQAVDRRDVGVAQPGE